MRLKALGVVAAALSLAACGPAENTTPAASNPPAAASGRDSCLLGTWNVDVNDMAQQTAAKVGNGATGTGTGPSCWCSATR